jgi:hypothetical protein
MLTSGDHDPPHGQKVVLQLAPQPQSNTLIRCACRPHHSVGRCQTEHPTHAFLKHQTPPCRRCCNYSTCQDSSSSVRYCIYATAEDAAYSLLIPSLSFLKLSSPSVEK